MHQNNGTLSELDCEQNQQANLQKNLQGERSKNFRYDHTHYILQSYYFFLHPPNMLKSIFNHIINVTELDHVHKHYTFFGNLFEKKEENKTKIMM